MSRPRLLDRFCGSGGATRGYQLAGFYVVGVDIEPQPNYCGDEFYQADALDEEFIASLGPFDAQAGSPPCHDHSTVTGRNRKAAGVKGTGWMLAATIAQMQRAGLPFAVENVGFAKFPPDVYRL